MKHALRLVGRGLSLVLLVALLIFAALAWQIDQLGRRDDARPADAIVVLGARVNADGQPGSDLTSRTYHAVDLWQAGLAPNIICTGGFHDEPLSSAAVCKRFAVQLGVPAARVFLADGTSDTVGDAHAATAVMADHSWRTAILVSHPLHVYRARWLFRRAGVDAVTSPTTTDTSRIHPLLRFWYATREAGAIAITVMDGWGWFPPAWKARLQTWSYGLP